MKWNCGPSYAERHKARTLWHRWFAWHPVRVGARDCRWLERVERRLDNVFGDTFFYRHLGSADDRGYTQ